MIKSNASRGASHELLASYFSVFDGYENASVIMVVLQDWFQRGKASCFLLPILSIEMVWRISPAPLVNL